jgi:hypothetical protein
MTLTLTTATTCRTHVSDLLCPSTHASAARVVLGSGAPGTRLIYETERRPPTTHELDLTTTRLAGPCHTTSCSYWADKCMLGSTLADTAVSLRMSGTPHCTIRPECRWFAENGRAACGACALVRYAATSDSRAANL